jgi:hypothetical protein
MKKNHMSYFLHYADDDYYMKTLVKNTGRTQHHLFSVDCPSDIGSAIQGYGRKWSVWISGEQPSTVIKLRDKIETEEEAMELLWENRHRAVRRIR